MHHRRNSPSPARSVLSPSDDEEDDDGLEDDIELNIDPHPHTQWIPNLRDLTISPQGHHSKSLANYLPHEILIHIFKKLVSREDQHSTLLVSRAWCQCSVELLWYKLSINKLASLFKMLHIITRKDQTFHYATFVRRLNFANQSAQITDPLFIRFAACTRLERLTLAGCTTLTDESLIRVLSSCPGLVAVDLTGVIDVTDASIIALALSTNKLQGINLTKCKKVTDDGIVALAEHSPALRRIKLHGLISLTDAAVSAIARLCPLLLEIDVSNCVRVTDLSVREIWMNQRHLREFQLANIVGLTQDAFPSPPQSGLAIAINPFASAPPQPAEPEGLPPLLLPNIFDHLRILDMTSCSLLTDEGLDGIVSNAPKIRHLVLAKCSKLTDEALISLGKLGRHLHYIHMGHVTNITDRGVAQLCQACPRIRYVDMACCSSLTDLSVVELAALPKLRRIGLVRLPNLTDNAVFALGEKHTALERIHLSYCDNISVGAVHFMLQRLTKLTHLSLTGIQQFRRKDLRRYCRPPPREFNSHQRAAFCVYSGKGVIELRRYLHVFATRAMDMNRDPGFDDDGGALPSTGDVEEAESEPDEGLGVEGDGDGDGGDGDDDAVLWPQIIGRTGRTGTGTDTDTTVRAPQPQHYQQHAQGQGYIPPHSAGPSNPQPYPHANNSNLYSQPHLPHPLIPSTRERPRSLPRSRPPLPSSDAAHTSSSTTASGATTASTSSSGRTLGVGSYTSHMDGGAEYVATPPEYRAYGDLANGRRLGGGPSIRAVNGSTNRVGSGGSSLSRAGPSTSTQTFNPIHEDDLDNYSPPGVNPNLNFAAALQHNPTGPRVSPRDRERERRRTVAAAAAEARNPSLALRGGSPELERVNGNGDVERALAESVQAALGDSSRGRGPRFPPNGGGGGGGSGGPGGEGRRPRNGMGHPPNARFGGSP